MTHFFVCDGSGSYGEIYLANIDSWPNNGVIWVGGTMSLTGGDPATFRAQLPAQTLEQIGPMTGGAPLIIGEQSGKSILHRDGSHLLPTQSFTYIDHRTKSIGGISVSNHACDYMGDPTGMGSIDWIHINTYVQARVLLELVDAFS